MNNAVSKQLVISFTTP